MFRFFKWLWQKITGAPFESGIAIGIVEIENDLTAFDVLRNPPHLITKPLQIDEDEAQNSSKSS